MVYQMTKKLYIKTWGCQMNEYDSSRISDLLYSKNNYFLTQKEEEADILLLNTCSIREKAQEKVFHQLGRWKNLKKYNPNLIIGVGGCVASQEGKRIHQRAPYVDIIFGPQTLHLLPKMILNVNKYKNSIVNINFLKIEKFNYLPKQRVVGPRAFVSIMEGCSKYCSYCIVPYTRGKEISRPYDDIILEIIDLASQGVREINLLGQNVNAYYYKSDNGKICTFAKLLRLVAIIDGIDRIRFTTSNPMQFTDDIIEVYRDIPKLVSFLHLPVQSGSDRILKLMKRFYTVLDYKNIIYKLRSVRPNIEISSDFIVGFPGESQKDFEETISLINDIKFDISFSFVYSPRPGTPAAKIPDNTTNEEKKKRLSILQNHINQTAKTISKNMLGSVQRVLVDSISRKNIMEVSGRTENNRVVNFKGSTEMIGKFVDIKIVDIYNTSLRGQLY